MQCYPIPVPSLNTAQQYAETAGSLAEALHELFLRRPCIRTDPANPGAQAAYYRAVGAWYMENNSIIAAALMACRLLSDGAPLNWRTSGKPPNAPQTHRAAPQTARTPLGIHIPCLNPKARRMHRNPRHPQTRERIRKPPAGCCSIGRPL